MSELVTIVEDAHYPEGPLWLDGRLYWVEFARDAVMVMVPEQEQKRALWVRHGAGPAAVARGTGDELWVTAYESNQVICIGRDGTTREVLGEDDHGCPFVGPNDLVMDRQGGLYFTASGVFELDAPMEGKVFYRGPGRDRPPVAVADGIHYANGVAITQDGAALFVSEHFQNRVLRYDVGPDGVLSGGRVFAELTTIAPPPRAPDPRLGPDGLKVTSSGEVLIAQYGGGRVIAVRPDGRLDRVLDLPYRFTTNVALGRSEHTLWITAFKEEVPPYPGAVFMIETSPA